MFRPGDDVNQFIRDNYLDMTDEQMAIAVGSTAKAIKNRRQRLGLNKTAKVGETPKPTYPAGLGKLAELLEKSGIDPENIGQVERARVNTWQGFMKDDNGEAKVVDLEAASIVLSPKWADGPKFETIQMATPANIKPARYTPPKRDYKQAVILPDPQFGFRSFPDGTLDPFHDERALSVALSVVSIVKPDLIVILGDYLDLPAFSRYDQEPYFAHTTQPAIQRGHEFLAQLRATCPNAHIALIAGNHDDRIRKSILSWNKEALHIKRADTPEGWPVFSIPNLLALDTVGVEYVDGYPAGQYWVNDRLLCIHGLKVRSGGSTAKAVADDERVSTIFGHVHRIEWHYKTVRVRGGLRTNFAGTPGCLCRIDGTVPSMKGGVDFSGKPISSAENWQQGLAVVTYNDGDAPFALEQVYIDNGSAIFRGIPISPGQD